MNLVDSFKNFGFSDELFNSIKRMGITVPTEIQSKAIPDVMNGYDVMAESSTGSGKTLTFGCKIIENTIPKKGIQALVLTPTRELSEQVKKALKEMSRDKHLNITSIYGGVSIERQMDELRKTDIVVATPGRLLDHLNRRTIDLSRVNMLILDEADSMLDMGFIDDVEDIIRACPKERQTLFFSATMPPSIQRLAEKHMKNYVEVRAEPQVDPTKLTQVYYDIPRNRKIALLTNLIEKEDTDLVMIFCNTRRSTDYVVSNLKANKIDAIAIHGGLTQNKRTKTLDNFNNAKVEVLVCTDVAARGLHINNVSHVYNYDIPNDARDYVHRIGRTARAGESGRVINLLSETDHDNFSRIMREYRDYNIDHLQTPFLEKVKTVAPQNDSPRGNFGGRRPQRNGPRGNFRSGGDRPSGGSNGSRRDGPRRDGPRPDGQRRNFGPRNGPRGNFRSGGDRPSGGSNGSRRDGPRRDGPRPDGQRRNFDGPKGNFGNRSERPRNNRGNDRPRRSFN